MSEIRMRCNYRATRDVGPGRVQTEFTFQFTDDNGNSLTPGMDGSASLNVVGDNESEVIKRGDIITFAVNSEPTT